MARAARPAKSQTPAVGQTCASRRNRHRDRNDRAHARLAARHRFTGQLVEVVRDASEKEGGHGHRPCEETRAPVGVRTSWQLQKSAGSILASNKLARSAPKRVAVRVNGGLVGAGSVRWHASVHFPRHRIGETMVVCRPAPE
jgi:hypothetical protein